MRFSKMQGIGNDYIYVSLFTERVEDPSSLAVAISRPHFGIGADGLVLIGPSEKADFSMRIFNPDGSESEMCGNACRCVGKYVYERGLTDRTQLTLETPAGMRGLALTVSEGKVDHVRVDMGRPELNPVRIPVNAPGTRAVRLPVDGLELTCVSMGNPHAVLFTEDLSDETVARLGPKLEHHPLFPHRTNVEFVRVEAPDRLRVRVWERGVGETLACGTGACAALVAANLCGLCERSAEVALPGGSLRVSWLPDGHVTQEGPAEFVYDGDWLE
ncbi:MAG: diaminopimelate epimerase [Clostridia bacterium]|nr:diaminopimelate epimerase [Clostridia bacterium]